MGGSFTAFSKKIQYECIWANYVRHACLKNAGSVYGNHIQFLKTLLKYLVTRGAYDLHFTYTGFTCTDSDLPTVPPWIPIDPAIILPSHWKKSRIPATFDPPGRLTLTYTTLACVCFHT